jgi:hypothetical protein
MAKHNFRRWGYIVGELGLEFGKVNIDPDSDADTEQIRATWAMHRAASSPLRLM